MNKKRFSVGLSESDYQRFKALAGSRGLSADKAASLVLLAYLDEFAPIIKGGGEK